MVDVTTSNFDSVLKAIPDVIRNCDFIALDLELSGLDETHCRNTADLPQSRFKRCRRDVLKYTPVQVGLAFFQYDEDDKKYTVRPYNFYVFPFHNSSQFPDMHVQFLTSSMSFLSSHGFDFNKWVNCGIPFVSVAKEDQMRRHMEQHFDDLRKEETSPQKDQEFKRKDAQELIDAEFRNADFLRLTREQLRALKDEGDECQIKDANSFQRRLVFKIISSEFSEKNLVGIVKSVEGSQDNKDKYILVKKLSVGSRTSRLDYQQKVKLEDLNACVGFTNIMKLISESDKMIVGHNMLMDILHIHNTFFGPVSESYENFKASINSIFPKICDTKVLATTKPFKTHIPYTGLETLFNAVSQKPFKKPVFKFAVGFDKYDQVGAAHEAGYDAYMTGFIFASLLNYLGSLVKPPKAHIPCSSELVTPFVNKIFLMRILDLYYMDLENDDVIPRRHDMFYLMFPKEWKTRDIVKLFEKFGNSIQVNWINDVSCFVKVEGMRDPATTILKTVALAAAGAENFSICTFDEYHEKFEDNGEANEDATQPEISTSKNGVGDSIRKLSATQKRASEEAAQDLGEEIDPETLMPKDKKVKTK